MDTYLNITEVTKRYANHLAIEKVSVQVPRQGIFGLLGPNGAGKTTLIRIINQIIGADEGAVYLVRSQSGSERLGPEHTRYIGYLPEERGLYKKMKVGEQAMYLAQLKGLDRFTAKKRLQQWFEKFEIGNWWNRKVEELSKGMQQKVQFVVTVVHEPELLIFDEPFSGFDPINVNLLRSEILRLRDQGATILLSTHNMASVEELCDHIALINRSRKILDGSVEAIKREYRTHTFELKLSSLHTDIQNFIPSQFEILHQHRNNYGETTLRIKSAVAIETNTLIQRILPHANIIAFNEILPTMNDIFIKKVKEGSLDDKHRDSALLSNIASSI